jgi:hypothetical protein
MLAKQAAHCLPATLGADGFLNVGGHAMRAAQRTISRRTDMIDKRREMMAAWAKFATGQGAETTVPLA